MRFLDVPAKILYARFQAKISGISLNGKITAQIFHSIKGTRKGTDYEKLNEN